MALVLAAAGATVLGGIGYFLGFLDRPEFEYRSYFLQKDCHNVVTKTTAATTNEGQGSESDDEVYMLVVRAQHAPKKYGDYCPLLDTLRQSLRKMLPTNAAGDNGPDNTDKKDDKKKPEMALFGRGAHKLGIPDTEGQALASINLGDPNDRDKLIWCLGWMIGASSWQEAQDIARKANEVNTEREKTPLVALRLGKAQPTLTGRVPFRSKFSPTVRN